MHDPQAIRAKICGLTRPQDVAAAAAGGAAYVGFVHFPASPRHLSLADAAALAMTVPKGIQRVALTVDADDATLERLVAQVPIDMLQLHGHESPGRVANIRARHGLPVMKAIGVAEARDLEIVAHYALVVDQLLIDARPPKDAVLPGGNGLSFDWRILKGRKWPVPWMLAGGLTPDNLAAAIRLTGARQVDVSSGVEREKGIKDPDLIRRFLATARDVEPEVEA